MPERQQTLQRLVLKLVTQVRIPLVDDDEEIVFRPRLGPASRS